jgi:hypothetical protein
MKESHLWYLVALINSDLGLSPSINWNGSKGTIGSASLHLKLMFLISITSMPFSEITIRNVLDGREELIELRI